MTNLLFLDPFQMSNIVPAFTILENAIDNEPLARQIEEPEMAPWMSQYQSNVSSPPPNSSLMAYDMPHMIQDYPTPNLSLPAPQMPSSYAEALRQNAGVSKRNMKYNLPAVPPGPLPSYPEFPYTQAPYGLPYPSNGYSQFDGILASDAGIQAAYAGPGVPAASWPALQDARDSPSTPMTPYLLSVVEQKFKEGYKAGQQDHIPSCQENYHHALSCPVCRSASIQSTRMYQAGIIFLGIVVAILLILLLRK